MSDPQGGILAEVPVASRYLELSAQPDCDLRPALGELATLASSEGDDTVVGIGPGIAATLGTEIAGLHPFPSRVGPGCLVPSTQSDLWIWLRGTDRGELVHRGRGWRRALGSGFRVDRVIDGFRFGPSLDLTRYEDGTENPTGAEAVSAAIVRGAGAGLDGSSFVAVQQWEHDLNRFEAMSGTERDHVVGRALATNEELADAPASAHVKRTAQESFEPEAFVLRRSMPWSDADTEGLVFVAFGHSVAAYEALLARMTGAEDGIVDALFRFTRPRTGSYFWCPPRRNAQLDLSALGLGS